MLGHYASCRCQAGVQIQLKALKVSGRRDQELSYYGHGQPSHLMTSACFEN
jgi:hypothetical protein